MSSGFFVTYGVHFFHLISVYAQEPIPSQASAIARLAKAYPQLTGQLFRHTDGSLYLYPSPNLLNPEHIIPEHPEPGAPSQLPPLANIPAPLLAQGPPSSPHSTGSHKPAISFLDTLAQDYPLGHGHRTPAPGFNPGRLRATSLLGLLYGTTSQEVQQNCEQVNFLGTHLAFNRRHGAAAALRRVVTRLEGHLVTHPQDRAYILPSAGTFAWRTVRDTGLPSAHSFGVAIDLNAAKGLYWLWKPSAKQVEQARIHYPQAIVDAFEAEGFIWGGKWDAFDFMHFEYRPELVVVR